MTWNLREVHNLSKATKLASGETCLVTPSGVHTPLSLNSALSREGQQRHPGVTGVWITPCLPFSDVTLREDGWSYASFSPRGSAEDWSLCPHMLRSPSGDSLGPEESGNYLTWCSHFAFVPLLTVMRCPLPAQALLLLSGSLPGHYPSQGTRGKVCLPRSPKNPSEWPLHSDGLCATLLWRSRPALPLEGWRLPPWGKGAGPALSSPSPISEGWPEQTWSQDPRWRRERNCHSMCSCICVTAQATHDCASCGDCLHPHPHVLTCACMHVYMRVHSLCFCI